ncbi:MAG: hypothetical protein GF393_11595 [Armatimonadia bacterium]|nr:hypothetical protein [Armatimonadia bacterium]
MARMIHALTSSTRSKVILAVTVVLLICTAVGLSQALSWFKPPVEALAAIPTWDELTGDLPADSDNAALLYERAFTTADLEYPEALVVEEILHSRRSPDVEELAELRALLEGREEAIALVHEATALRDCAYSLVPREGIAGDFPHVRGTDDILLVESARALVAAEEGEFGVAFEALADGVHCGRMAFKGMPALKTFLVEVRAVERACEATQIILANGQPAPEHVGPLADALREVDLEADLVTAMRGEAAWGVAVFDSAMGQVQGRPASVLKHGAPGWKRYPMPKAYVKANRRVFIEEMARVIETSSRPYRASTALLQETPREFPGYARLAAMMVPTLKVPMLRRDETIAWQHMCLAALEITAKGDAPETLADLRTPADDALVRDVFSGNHLRYARTADGYLLYSLGRDLDDDGGVPQQHTGHAADCDGDLVWSAGA